MMLFSMLTAAQGGKSIAYLSRTFGLSDRQMTNVIRHYLPVLTKGIQKNFAQQGGLASLLKTLDHGNYSSYYDDPNIYTNPQVRHNGLIIMERAIGSISVQRQILNRIYQSTGIDPDTLQLILPFVTILALSALYRKANGNILPQNVTNGLEYRPQNKAQPQQMQNSVQQNGGKTSQDDMHHEIHKHLMQQEPQQAPQYVQQRPQAASQQTQNFAPQQQPQMQNNAPQSQNETIGNERLPNIILQAQEAHAKRQKQSNGKSRLRNLLKASKKKPVEQPVQNDQLSQKQTPQQAQNYQASAAMQHTRQAPSQPHMHHQMPQYAQQQQIPVHQQQQMAPQQAQQDHMHQATQMPAPRRRTRKYVSLQEKLHNELPWYDQVQRVT